MKFGIIGTNYITRVFLDGVYKNGGILEAVYSRKQETGEAFAKDYSVSKVYTDMNAFLNDSEVEIVYIASPNGLHHAQTMNALKQHKHVIVEKPVASTAKEWLEAMQEAKNRKLFLFEAITNQHLPNYRYIHKILPQIGRVRLVQCNFSQYSSKYNALLDGQIPNVFNPKFAGGCLYDINVYNIHFVVGLFGLPQDVHYFANKHENGIDLSGVVVMQYHDFICQCSAAKDSASMNCVQIQGERGYILVKSSSSACQEIELHIGNEVTIYNQQEDPNLLYYENVDFKKIIEEKDYDARDFFLNESYLAIQVLEKARLNANIVFK